MIDLREIRSVTDFQKNIKTYVTKLKGSHTPMVLTVNGKAELVVQDAETYQQLLDEVEEARFVAAVNEALDDYEKGVPGMGVGEAFESIRQDLGL